MKMEPISNNRSGGNNFLLWSHAQVAAVWELLQPRNRMSNKGKICKQGNETNNACEML